MMRKLLTFMAIALLLTACRKEEEKEFFSERTVLVYMSGENNLSSSVDEDLYEMLQAKTDANKHCLLVYVDDQNKSHMPYVARIRNGARIDSVSVKDMGISNGDVCSANPEVMKAVISYAFRKYPSQNNDYALVLWGHASGWVIDDSVSTTAKASARRKAYGYDSGRDSNSKEAWMNMHTLAEVLSQGPHLKYIFADCCHFQSLESLYELRHVADYIIGSPAEIPGVGAPYTTVTPALFEPETFYTSIIDRYYEQTFSGGRSVPLSAVKTSAMEQLAQATRNVLLSIKDTLSLTAYPNVNSLIHYYYSPLFNDANDFMLRYAKPEAYAAWKSALDEAVVYKKMATKWMTNTDWSSNYADFEMTEKRYGGVSLFVPQSPATRSNYSRYNADIKKTVWYNAVGLSEIGW